MHIGSIAPRLGTVTAFLLLLSVCFVRSALALTNLTWTGKSTSQKWSSAGNWSGRTAPATNQSIETLTLGQLPRACANNPADACYSSTNNVSGLSANAISVDDNAGYLIGGDAITVGAGGISAKPGSRPGAGFALLDLPIVLAAGQAWSVLANAPDATAGGLFVKSVSGDYPLSLTFSHDSSLLLGDADTGTITASGDGQIDAGSSLNGTSGNPVILEHGVKLEAGRGSTTVGPLSLMSGSAANLEEPVAGATLAVNGSATAAPGTSLRLSINQAGTVAGKDYGQLSATGAVNVAGADLDLAQWLNSNLGCADLHAGDVDRLITTTGALTGPFANAAPGATVTIKNECNDATHSATAVISYTANSVIATIKTPGDAGQVPVQTKPPRISGKFIEGQTLTTTRGRWSNKPTSYSYAWERCSATELSCSRIPGADRRTYKLTAADVGRFVLPHITAKNKAGKGVSAGVKGLKSPVKARGKRHHT